MDPKILATALLDDPLRRFDVQLWDGSSLPTRRQAAGRVILRTPEVVELPVPPVSEFALVAAFVDDRVDRSGGH